MPMSEATSNRVRELCSMIQVERDQHRFVKLVQELNRLLSEKDAHSPSDLHSGKRSGGEGNRGEGSRA
jgi:hypothetical protein